MWEVWKKKWYQDRFSFFSLRQFFLVSINAPELLTHSLIYHKRYVILEIDSVVK